MNTVNKEVGCVKKKMIIGAGRGLKELERFCMWNSRFGPRHCRVPQALLEIARNNNKKKMMIIFMAIQS